MKKVYVASSCPLLQDKYKFKKKTHFLMSVNFLSSIVLKGIKDVLIVQVSAISDLKNSALPTLKKYYWH